jgi:hypothetical protein
VNLRGTVVFVAGMLVALGAGWVGFPRAIYQSRPQPVDFSHKVHTGEKGGNMKCGDCHAFRGDGTFAGIPALDTCSACHAAAMGTTVAEKRFIEQYVTPNREPAWNSYSRQPQNVRFSHATHIKLAKLACERCHGPHQATNTLRVAAYDRLTGYSRDVWDRMKMDACINCHRQNRLAHSCLDCHK